jgi:hypothetical protein
MDDRRTSGRSKISETASLVFSGRTGARSCNVDVTDITEGGAGFKAHGPAILPVTFELSFDNLRRKCRMVWRRGNFFGVAFESQSTPPLDEKNDAIEIVIPQPALLAQNEPAQQIIENALGWSEHTSDEERKHAREHSFQFTAGIAIALGLPVFIGVTLYIATTAILRTG